MKKTLLIILTSLFISQVFSQEGYNELTKRVEYLENSNQKLLRTNDSLIKVIKNQFLIDSIQQGVLRSKIDSLTSPSETNKGIYHGNLQESIDNATEVISFQSTFINIFEVLFGAIAVLALFAYFFNIRPLINRTERALERAEDAKEKLDGKIDKFEKTVDSKLQKHFNDFEVQQKETFLNELFKDIESNFPKQKQLAIERLQTLPNNNFESDKIERLFNVIEDKKIKENEKRIIVEILMQINTKPIQRFFKTWKNVLSGEQELKNCLIRYYSDSKSFEAYIDIISYFILQPASPSVEFNRILDMLPSHPNQFYSLINHSHLINSLDHYEQEQVLNHITKSIKSWTFIDKNNIERSYLYSILNKEKSDTSNSEDQRE